MTPSPEPEQTAPPDPHTILQGSAGVRYVVRAAAEPTLLPRLLASLSRRGVTPQRVSSDLSADGRELVIDVQLAGIDPGAAARVLRCLPQIRGVASVRASEQPARMAAQLLDAFLDEQIAWIERTIAGRLAAYEFLVSTGFIRRDRAVSEYVNLTALHQALKAIRNRDTD